eukprot:6380670-Prymnesium_polylepis.1
MQTETWLHEVRRVCMQMNIILDEIPPEHAAAARALQAALVMPKHIVMLLHNVSCLAWRVLHPRVVVGAVAQP